MNVSQQLGSNPPPIDQPILANQVNYQMPSTDLSYYQQGGNPFGVSINDALRIQSQLNASFSQNSWQNAMQDGCLPKVTNPLPSWPPVPKTGFVYPSLGDKKEQTLLDLGVATGCPETYALEAPYASGGQFSWKALAEARGVPLDTVNSNQCPPNGRIASNESRAPNEAMRRTGALNQGDMASRVAAKILGLQPPPSATAPFPSVTGQEMYYSGDTPSPSVPSPSPYDKPECVLDNPKFSLGEVLPCTWNTVEGIAYDIRHWSQLPKQSFLSKFAYVLGRDDRPFYLILMAVVIILTILILRAILFGGGRKSSPYAGYGSGPYGGYPTCPPPQIVAVPIQVPAQWTQPVKLAK